MKKGFTCGSFDLLHAGHALMLRECKDHCDYLIVGTQVDPSKDRCQKNMPIQTIEERIIRVKSIRWVDEIFVYETEKDLYETIRLKIDSGDIDIRIIGADWKGKKYTGHDLPIERN